MKNRPYFKKSVVDLQVLFESSKDDVAELKKLAAELKHRQVPKAIALLTKVKAALAKFQATRGTIREGKTPESEPETHAVLECQECGQRMRVELSPEKCEYTCSSCKVEFFTSFQKGVFSAVFAKPNRSETHHKECPIESLSLAAAYRLFDADPDTPWEVIELNRRRLIQQYHPDKVASLGPKLREVAEIEGKKINVAFSMLRDARGLGSSR